jgi:hypothetical protein
MHPEIARLAALMEDAATLLATYDSTEWAVWLRENARLVSKLDFHGVQRLLAAYGGMGSFNDLLLCPTGSDSFNAPATQAANE